MVLLHGSHESLFAIHLRQLLEVLAAASSAKLGRWSLRTAERSLLWASLVEKEAGGHDGELVQSLVDNFRHDAHRSKQIPPEICRLPSAREKVLSARRTLLQAVLGSFFVNEKIRLWALGAYEKQTDFDPVWVVEDLEMCEMRKDWANKQKELQELGDAQRIERHLVAKELARFAEYRKGWEMELAGQEASFAQVEMILMILVEFLKGEGSCENIEVAAGTEEEFGAWLVKVTCANRLVWIQKVEVLEDIAAQRIDFAGKYLSYLLVEVDRELDRLDQTEQPFLERLRRFCNKAPWLRTFTLCILEDSSSKVGDRLREKLKSST